MKPIFRVRNDRTGQFLADVPGKGLRLVRTKDEATTFSDWTQASSMRRRAPALHTSIVDQWGTIWTALRWANTRVA
jgi:hypothetical protein